MSGTIQHPPFSLRASWRETTAFVAGSAAMIGAFGPWLHVSGTEHRVMADDVQFAETLWGGLSFGTPIALLCALAIAAAFAPVRPTIRVGARTALFGLALAIILGGVAWLATWGSFHVFRESEQWRPAWGLVLTVGGTLVAFGASLSRLLWARAARRRARAEPPA